MKNHFDLTGKVALVTGGSRGMGKEIVKAFADAGADVMIVSRKGDACKTLAEEIENTTGRKALGYAAHVGRWDELDGVVDAAYHHFGRVDILVNNAGMSPLYKDLVGVTEDLYDKVLNVNLKGPFRLMSLVGTRMFEGEGGSIINMSSVASFHPTGGTIPYAGAKAGLNAMTVGFAHAFGPNVRVNCIVPGPFLTDISKAWDMEAFNKGAKKRMALQRGGQANEIVGAALYFASDASSFTTGALLRVDGGDRITG